MSILDWIMVGFIFVVVVVSAVGVYKALKD
jgi:hypothetical protein